MRRSSLSALAALALVLCGATAAQATWSIVITDSYTKEVAIGTVTCLLDYDLLGLVPAVVVGKGAGAVQAAGDFDGKRRPIIFDQLKLGTPPDEILAMLSTLSGHQQRQYGIADTLGRMITFTGTDTFDWAGGVVGSQGMLVYAIQGNILAGDCVVPAIEQALLEEAGDIPAKLMAGMKAARDVGGDGRCSCSPTDPTGCGCPPTSFTKSGHIGGMIVARIGDIDDPKCSVSGCADGVYFMRLNVAYQTWAKPDPVTQLETQFDKWRSGLVGQPDAIQSTVTFEPAVIPPDGASTTTMFVTLLDWQGLPITISVTTLDVVHAADSAKISTIGQPVDHGNGSFTVPLTAGTTAGVDRFKITVYGGTRAVVLMPNPALAYFAYGDLNCDGAINAFDIDPFVLALVDPDGYAAAYPNCSRALADCNQDGKIDAFDIDPFVDLLTRE